MQNNQKKMPVFIVAVMCALLSVAATLSACDNKQQPDENKNSHGHEH